MVYDISSDSIWTRVIHNSWNKPNNNTSKVIPKEVLIGCEKEWELIEKKIEKLQDKGDNDTSLQIGIDKAVSLLLKEGKLHYLQDQALLNLFKKKKMDLDYGCFLNDTSLWYFDCDRELEGDDYIPITEGGLGNTIMKHYNYNDNLVQKEFMYDVKLNVIVIGISYITKDKEQLLEILTNSGIFLCRFCVCTIPLGVLKKNVVSFTPSLPQSYYNSLSQSEMGLLNKSILIFENPFWDLESTVLVAFGEKSNEVWWILNLYQVTNQPILVLFTGTEYAVTRELQSDITLTTSAISILQRMYGSEKAFHTRWGSDPFSFGSYSFRKVGFKPESGFKGFQTHYYDGKFIFAGEHTSSDAFATVHGAIESGKRAAKQILKGLENQKK